MTIEQQIKELISQATGKSITDITNENNIVEDFDINSLEKIELMFSIEDEFSLFISDEDGEKIETVQQAIDYVKLKTAEE